MLKQINFGQLIGRIAKISMPKSDDAKYPVRLFIIVDNSYWDPDKEETVKQTIAAPVAFWGGKRNYLMAVIKNGGLAKGDVVTIAYQLFNAKDEDGKFLEIQLKGIDVQLGKRAAANQKEEFARRSKVRKDDYDHTPTPFDDDEDEAPKPKSRRRARR